MRVPGRRTANLVGTRSHAPQVRPWETFAENSLSFTSSPATPAGNVSLSGNQNYISQNSVGLSAAPPELLSSVFPGNFLKYEKSAIFVLGSHPQRHFHGLYSD